jgi:hypothetical protein
MAPPHQDPLQARRHLLPSPPIAPTNSSRPVLLLLRSPTSPRVLPRPHLRPVSQILPRALPLRLTLAAASLAGDLGSAAGAAGGGCCETPGRSMYCHMAFWPEENFTAAPLRRPPLASAPAAPQISATDLHSAP